MASALLVGSLAWPTSLFGQTASGAPRVLASVNFGGQVATQEIADSAIELIGETPYVQLPYLVISNIFV